MLRKNKQRFTSSIEQEPNLASIETSFLPPGYTVRTRKHEAQWDSEYIGYYTWDILAWSREKSSEKMLPLS